MPLPKQKKIKSIGEILKIVEEHEVKKPKNLKLDPMLSFALRTGKTKKAKKSRKEQLLSDYEKARIIKERLNKRKPKKPKTQIAMIRKAREKYEKDVNIFDVAY